MKIEWRMQWLLVMLGQEMHNPNLILSMEHAMAGDAGPGYSGSGVARLVSSCLCAGVDVKLIYSTYMRSVI